MSYDSVKIHLINRWPLLPPSGRWLSHQWPTGGAKCNRDSTLLWFLTGGEWIGYNPGLYISFNSRPLSVLSGHEDKAFLHFHMMINNISWIDGVEPLSHYISQMNLDSLAYAVLKDYQDYYMIHKESKFPSANLMAKDAFYRFISDHYSEL